MNERDLIQSIERGFTVLGAFDEETPRPSAAELAARTGYSRPAVRRILLTLQHLGYVSTDGVRWTLTPRVLSIGQHYGATHSIVEVALPHLYTLAEATGESASLGQLDSDVVVSVAQARVPRVMSMDLEIGSRLPIHATAMGRVLLAWAKESEIQEVVATTGLPAYTERTVTDSVAFRDALHEVRSSGWSIVDGEFEEGLLTASTPVRDHRGEVVAALAHLTTRLRSSPRQLETGVIPTMLETSAQISRELASLARASRKLTTRVRDGFF